MLWLVSSIFNWQNITFVVRPILLSSSWWLLLLLVACDNDCMYGSCLFLPSRLMIDFQYVNCWMVDQTTATVLLFWIDYLGECELRPLCPFCSIVFAQSSIDRIPELYVVVCVCVDSCRMSTLIINNLSGRTEPTRNTQEIDRIELGRTEFSSFVKLWLICILICISSFISDTFVSWI